MKMTEKRMADAGKQPEAIPDWLHETPDSESYNLTMFSWDGDSIQDISMSRAEYIALKKHLATLREKEAHAEE